MTKNIFEYNNIIQNTIYEKIMSNLIHAIYSNNNKKVFYLINNGADVNYCDSNGYTPLYAAYKENNISIIKLLIKYGVDINDPKLAKGEGLNILHYLVINGIIKVNINNNNNVPEEILNGIDMLNNYHKIKDIKNMEEHVKFAIEFEKNVILCKCGEKKIYRCAQCQSAGYCSLKCQKNDWKHHKKACKAISYFINNN